MNHPTFDDLVLHYYREQPAEAARSIDSHLAICVECDAAWRELGEAMSAMDEAVVPDPAPDFDERMWRRVSAGIAAPARAWSLRHTAWVAGWAAVVGLLAGAGYAWTRVEQRPAAPAAQHVRAVTAPGDMRERVLLTALSDHFTQTEMLLVELLNAPDAPSDIAFERSAASDLVASGRLYRQTAAEDGDLQLAGMLDDLEGVLVEVARSPARMDPRDLGALRARISDDDLLFKVRAVRSDVRDRRRTLME